MLYRVLFTLCWISVAYGAFLRKQKLCVFGKVECSSEPDFLRGHAVKLWDEDEGPNPDDLMSFTLTRKDGSFEACGQAGDLYGTIDPVFKIYTLCNNGLEKDPRCFRKIVFPIPQSYVGGNYTFSEPIDLARRSITESRRCFTGSAFSDLLKRYTGLTSAEWIDRLTGQNATGLMKLLTMGAGLVFDEQVNATENTLWDISQK